MQEQLFLIDTETRDVSALNTGSDTDEIAAAAVAAAPVVTPVAAQARDRSDAECTG